MFGAWLHAFILTQVIEAPLYIWALRGPSTPLGVNLLVALGASTLTHPIVWFVIPKIIPLSHYWIYFIVAESFAIGVEALYLRLFGLKNWFGWSCVANGLSASFGLFIN